MDRDLNKILLMIKNGEISIPSAKPLIVYVVIKEGCQSGLL